MKITIAEFEIEVEKQMNLFGQSLRKHKPHLILICFEVYDCLKHDQNLFYRIDHSINENNGGANQSTYRGCRLYICPGMTKSIEVIPDLSSLKP